MICASLAARAYSKADLLVEEFLFLLFFDTSLSVALRVRSGTSTISWNKAGRSFFCIWKHVNTNTARRAVGLGFSHAQECFCEKEDPENSTSIFILRNHLPFCTHGLLIVARTVRKGELVLAVEHKCSVHLVQLGSKHAILWHRPCFRRPDCKTPYIY